MEFLRVVKRRSLLSETIYILLNVALAVAVLGLVWTTGSPWLALILVLLSKWRVLAVRPRYWLAHIEANMVDIIVSVSFVLLISIVNQAATSQMTVVQIVLAILYAGWLLFIKPRAKRSIVVIQAATALALGTMTLESISYEWPSSAVVLALWAIGFSCARHVLSAYSEPNLRLLSLLWAFVIAEIGWLTYHWTIAYTLPFGGGLRIPQATLIIIGLSFLAERVYNSYHKHETVRMADIALPAVFTLGVIAVLLIAFSSASIGAV